MISEVEKLTSIENAGRGLVLGSINLSNEIERVAMTFEPLFSAKSVELKREIEEGVMLAADGDKIRRAVGKPSLQCLEVYRQRRHDHCLFGKTGRRCLYQSKRHRHRDFRQ